ncbi:7136_t:CDS:2 [Cetraspora pellucida]|uniref:7136_t:CDS:1 n=1 Tax=Cetraspora pellucida TaxID=1433469 RepID=A0ACA9M9G9_9GLOM|nr:7136_t:CDS:2 [Cetraspora pellucida]
MPMKFREINVNLLRHSKKIDYPDHFILESVKERLDKYDISTLPDLQALTDVMIMLYICPAKLTTLHITNSGLTDYMKNRGAVYTVVMHRAKNLAHAMTIAEEALCHNPDNNTSPAQNYVVVNYRRKNQSPEENKLVIASKIELNMSFHEVFNDKSKVSSSQITIEDAIGNTVQDFLSNEPTTTLVCSPVITGKTKALRIILNSFAKESDGLLCFVWVSYRKTLSNETKAKVDILQNAGLYTESTHRLSLYEGHSYVIILDEVNAIMRQMNSGVHAQESENAIWDLTKSAIHVLAMDAFANESTLNFLRQYRDEDIRVFDNKYQPYKESKHVAFSVTSCKKARAIAVQASKLLKSDGLYILLQVYFSQMNEKQHQDDFADINAT